MGVEHRVGRSAGSVTSVNHDLNVMALALVAASAVLWSLLSARLERLSERGRHIAALASAIGQEFDFALLDRAAAIGTHATAEAVEELVARRLLHAVGERLDFTHERIREVAYDQPIAPRRALLHGQVADAIEALYAENLEPYALPLGVHFRKAQRWEKALSYFRQAGLAAARRSAYGLRSSTVTQRVLRCRS